MIAVQYEFVLTMLRGSAYNCSSVMPPGQAWADEYGKKQLPFGVYSMVFGITTEILYIPCMIGLGRDLRSSCIKIMFCLSFLDMIAILANCVVFGYLLLEGAVYCSNPAMTLGAGMTGYGVWFTASACCLVLAINRLFEVLGLSKYFSSGKTTVYLGICWCYGIFSTLFTRPVIVNSTYQSMFFSPFIPGHSVDEYVNLPHAVHNISIAASFFLIYMIMCTVLVVKSRALYSSGHNARIISNMPVFVQAMLISCVNLISCSIYVFMNFIPVAPSIIVLGHVCWQISHGSPPFIYLALNKSIRHYTLKSIGLGRLVKKNQVQMFTTTHGTTLSAISHQPGSIF